MVTEENWKRWATLGSASIILAGVLVVSTYHHYVTEPRIEASKQELRESIQERQRVIQTLRAEQFEIMIDALETTLNRSLTDEEREHLWQEDQAASAPHVDGMAI